MDTTKCRACRSVNHATSIRCLNCGAPLDAVPIDAVPAAGSHPQGSPDLPPAPVPASWVSMVPAGGPTKQMSPASMFFALAGALVSVIAIIAVVMMVTGDGFTIATGPLKVYLLLALAMGLFWLWMLVDAISSHMDSGSKVMWVLLIVFLGFIGALAYAVMGRQSSRR